ncbi:hypothetical protein N2K17_01505 [Klebsiella michiganensis]|uniref:hypothetical protein n=1 Tax=Klebsiella michiganensis TaxID=1134687 RepID=UPI00224DD4DC|nr:hypothetical protein [Klebsiella michiganensis]MCX3078418.1 hypothetical protein [Klebsiella michiganensis]MCY0817709.1 hypothetical protein [Klebsiella michiganensis]
MKGYFKGTPGPWVIDANGVQSRWNVDDRHGNAVALTQQLPNDKLWEKRDANTQLISAAPELLIALQQMVSRIEYYARLKETEQPNIEDWAYTYNSSDMDDARVAIAKALGEQQ